jgi:hypothetical protein
VEWQIFKNWSLCSHIYIYIYIVHLYLYLYHLCLVPVSWGKLHTVSKKKTVAARWWHWDICFACLFLLELHKEAPCSVTSPSCTTGWRTWLLADSFNSYVLSQQLQFFTKRSLKWKKTPTQPQEDSSGEFLLSSPRGSAGKMTMMPAKEHKPVRG